MSFMKTYNQKVEQRATLGIPPLPLDAKETKILCDLLLKDPNEDLVYLLENRINPGVDDAALIKCQFLDQILNNEINCSLINKDKAINMLETMLGGYNVKVLIKALKDDNIAQKAANALKNIIFIHDDFDFIFDFINLRCEFLNKLDGMLQFK